MLLHLFNEDLQICKFVSFPSSSGTPRCIMLVWTILTRMVGYQSKCHNDIVSQEEGKQILILTRGPGQTLSEQFHSIMYVYFGMCMSIQ